MRRKTPQRISLVATFIVSAVAASLVPSASLTMAANPPPHIELHVGGTATPITVVARNQFVIDAFGFRGGEQVKFQATFNTYDGNTFTENRAAAANANGNVVNVTMGAPGTTKAGWVPLTATGQTSNKQAKGRVYVVYRPYITLNNKFVELGKSVQIIGHGFVSQAPVRLSIDINTDSGTQTLSQTITAASDGSFNRWMRIPNYTKVGTYTVTAVDTLGGFKRVAKLTVTQQPAPKPTNTPTPKATATPTSVPKPTFHAAASVVPGVTLPNQTITFIGTGFPANTRVTVSANVNLRDGSTRSLVKHPSSDAAGAFIVPLRVPYKTSPGVYTVTGSGSGAQASGQVQVLPLSAHPKSLGFRYVSVWYHVVHQGTWNVLVIQSTLKTKLGIWAHIIFPSGKRWDFYKNTDGNGHWQIRFTVPQGSASQTSNQVFIALQLWHGKQTTQSFSHFTLS